MSRLLLDTHAAVWIVEGISLRAAAQSAIRDALDDGSLFLSAVTAWELGLLVSKGRLHLSIPAERWIATVLERPGVVGLPLSIEATLGSSTLPGDFHQDPADRLLVATARIENIPILTRDDRILAYAAAGHVKALRC